MQKPLKPTFIGFSVKESLRKIPFNSPTKALSLVPELPTPRNININHFIVQLSACL